VTIGMGVAFWPDMSWGPGPNAKALRIHIQKPLCWRNVFLKWEPEQQLTAPEERFIDFVSDYFLSKP
jgi:hypothetical protein